MSETEISMENSRKLDRVITLLEGDGENVPGILSKVATHDKVLFGDKGGQGVVGRVAIMWRVHVWFLCSLSGACGYALKAIAEKILKP